MTITQNGNTLTWTGQVTLTNATNINTGVATLMLTPNGGVGNLPVFAQGTPGLPPVIDSVAVTQIAYNATPTAPVMTLVSPGGAGTASHYTLSFQVNQGAPGSSTSFQLQSATDLTSGTVTADTNGSSKTVLVNTTSPVTFRYASQAVGGTYNATTFTAVSGSNTTYTLATLTVPAQGFNWIPRVSGMAIASGTANTHVDIRCLLNSNTTGQQVGYGYGITGAGSGSIPAYPIILNQAFGGSLSGGYGVVSAGNQATLYFQCYQTAGTTDAYTISTNTMYFSVRVDPIPGTN